MIVGSGSILFSHTVSSEPSCIFFDVYITPLFPLLASPSPCCALLYYTWFDSTRLYIPSRFFNMAPALIETLPTAPYQSKKPVDINIFHDGIKTSGQHPPLYNLLRPYSDFPKVCTGPTVWKPEDYKHNPERWVHRFTAEEIEELGSTADRFIADGTPLTGISKVRHYCPSNEAFLTDYRATLFSLKSGSF